jgi:hypothetical protein
MHPITLHTHAELVTAERQRRAAAARSRHELLVGRRARRLAAARAAVRGMRRPARPVTSSPVCCPA